MKVTAKCTYDAWDSIACMRFYPGQEYEIEHDGALARMKTPTGRYVFQFDRNTESSSVSSSVAPPASPAAELTLPAVGEATPSPAVQEVSTPAIKVDRRGLGPRTCKPCGQTFANLSLLMKHKRDCPPKVIEGPASGKATQEAGATV